MDHSTNFDEVLDAAMAGSAASKVIADMRHLAPAERQRLLCFLCAAKDDIAQTCLDHATEVEKVLASQCSWFMDGRATCAGAGFRQLSSSGSVDPGPRQARE